MLGTACMEKHRLQTFNCNMLMNDGEVALHCTSVRLQIQALVCDMNVGGSASFTARAWVTSAPRMAHLPY